MVVICNLTGCKYNSSCCNVPHKGKKPHCMLNQINIEIDSETGVIDCRQYQFDYYKDWICESCKEKEKRAKVAIYEKTIKLFKQEIAKQNIDYNKALTLIKKIEKHHDPAMAQMMKEELYKRL